MEQLALPFVIIAIVEQFKTSFPSINGFFTLLLAIALGAVAGYFGVEGVDIYHGIILGISACGVHTTVSAIGRPKKLVSELPESNVVQMAN